MYVRSASRRLEKHLYELAYVRTGICDRRIALLIIIFPIVLCVCLCVCRGGGVDAGIYKPGAVHTNRSVRLRAYW